MLYIDLEHYFMNTKIIELQLMTLFYISDLDPIWSHYKNNLSSTYV